MSDEVTIKVGDRVRVFGDDNIGTVLALFDRYAWVKWDRAKIPASTIQHYLLVIPPEPVPVSWRNVYVDRVSNWYESRKRADNAAMDDRLGVVITYSNGSRKLEVVA